MRFTIWNTGADPAEFIAIAKAAEAANWDSLCLNEGTFQPERQEDQIYPFSADGKRSWSAETPYLEPMIILPAVATHTTTLRYLTFVLKLPLREPLTFGKQVATAAITMGNRLDLGVGMSWMPQEFQYCGLDWNTRKERFLESIDVLRLVLTGEMVEYHGRVFDFGRLMERPVPTTPVPIFIGGHKKPSLDIAAGIGDGWCGVPCPVAELEGLVQYLKTAVAAADRPWESFKIHAGAIDARTIDEYARLEAIGVTDCIVMPWMTALRDAGNDALGVPLSQRIELLQEFSEQIIRPLKGKH
jgi:alkanesulfonate monooxygenase SsuD/methylene tetrahydromethanopterin reductase-like flavin-dependent oxidoreductase (luciferase family)